MNTLLAKLRALFRRKNLEVEMAEEMRQHLAQRTAENIRAGMSLREAALAAQRDFGGIAQVQEQCRDERSFVWLEQLAQDVRYAGRSLRRSPAFTTVVVLTLALGIGANTAIFSVINAVLLKPLPYAQPGQLVQFRAEGQPGARGPMAGPRNVIGAGTIVGIKNQSQTLARVVAYSGGEMTLTGNAQAERVAGGQVSGDFFPLLGIQPVLGRNFTREEDTPNGPRAVILGHGLWQSRFGGDPGVLGQSVTLNKMSHVVVGILPASFQFPDQIQLWVPLALNEAGLAGGRGGRLLKAIGRLKPGVSLQQAQAELRAITGGGDLTLVGLHEQIVGNVKTTLWVLFGAVGFVLLIGCANVANLLLARAASRQREIAVRAALGAGRWRIVRQLLTESILLSVAGGGLGLLLAFWGVQALGQLADINLPAMHAIGIDVGVLAITLGLSVVTGLAFGLAPAFQVSRTDTNTALKGEGRGDTSAPRARLRHLLVVSELALALVLLIGAGLLIKSFSRLREVNPGFRADHVLTFKMSLTDEQFRVGQQKANFVEQVVERLKALPGVQATAATDSLPLTHFSRTTAAAVEGEPAKDPSEWIPISRAAVTADYFNTMGIPLKAGRMFTSQEERSSAGVMIVNETFQKLHFPGVSAIGKRIGVKGDEGWFAVVGVVADARQTGQINDVTPEVYRPGIQNAGGFLCFALRAEGEPASLVAAVRAAVAEVDRNQPIIDVMTMDRRLANTTSSRRLNAILLGGFATLALLLAVVGIYGVMSYAVTQRRREIGVRMALGAQTSDVLSLIVGRGLRLTLAGVAIGIGGALALTRTLSSLLYSVKTTDAETFVIVSIVLITTALVACWLPARRAAKVDPMIALRCE